jgi:hypothetical protein
MKIIEENKKGAVKLTITFDEHLAIDFEEVNFISDLFRFTYYNKPNWKEEIEDIVSNFKFPISLSGTNSIELYL